MEEKIGPVNVKFEFLEDSLNANEMRITLEDTGFWKKEGLRAYFYASRVKNKMFFVVAITDSALRQKEFKPSSLDMITSIAKEIGGTCEGSMCFAKGEVLIENQDDIQLKYYTA